MLRKTTKMNSKRTQNRSLANKGVKTALAGLLFGTIVACDAPVSKEDLNPAGPPMVRQVLMSETAIGVGGNLQSKKDQLAFGEHSDAVFDDDDKSVTTAAISGSQFIRIILDEQIRGNRLEEMECADGSYSRIPDGTTPDDVANCAGPVDSLQNCTIDLCIDKVKDSPTEGKPLGILDENEDGGPDKLRMIDYNEDDAITELGVSIICGDDVVPLSPTLSYWNPSGNQTVSSNPALGIGGLGPSVVLRPEAGVGMPSNVNCTIKFRPEVTDYDDNAVCAPAGGLITNDCANGDTTQIQFGTEPIILLDSQIPDGSSDVAITKTSSNLTFNSNMDVATTSLVTMTEGGVDFAVTVTVQEDDKKSMRVRFTNELKAETEYVITVGPTVTDLFGNGPAEDITITFTTGAEPVVPDAGDVDAAAEPDASAPDAGTPDAA